MTVKNIDSKIYYLALFILSAMYSINHFSGVDVFAGYYGMAFKLIHPESFVGDEYVTSNQTYMISLYSLVVKLFGDLWLDDRFVLLFYFALTFGILIIVGKISQKLGVETLTGKLAVMAILATEHPIISNVPQLMESGSFRPTSMSYPLAWILIYFLVSQAGWSKIWITAFCMLGMSVKNCWHPVLVVGLLFCKEYFQLNWKQLVGLSFLGFIAVLGGLYGLTAKADLFQDNLQVWRHSLGPSAFLEGSEASPYQDGFGPVVFLGVLLWAYFTPVIDKYTQKAFRFILITSAVVYIIGAQYYQFAPDSFKFPILVALALSRSTWWCQLIAFLILGTYAIRSLEKSQSKLKHFVLTLIIFGFPFFQFQWFKSFFKPYHLRNFGAERLFLIFGVTCVLSMSAWILFGRARKWESRFVFLISLFVSLNLFLANMAYRNRENLLFLARTGVMGGWAPSRWVEVNDYFRNQTPKDATVISFGVDPNEKSKMDVDYALKVRTGKTMPIHSEIGVYLNWPKRQHLMEVNEALSYLALYFNQCDLRRVPEKLEVVKNPDYIVLPTHLICFDIAQLTPYKLETKIGGYTVLRREKL